MIYYFDISGERSEGWKDWGLTELPKSLDEIKSPTVVVFHWSDWNEFVKGGRVSCQKNEAKVIFLFVSGNTEDIEKDKGFKAARNSREKILKRVFPSLRIFYYKVAHGKDSTKVLADYFDDVKNCLKQKKFDSIVSPREFYEAKKPDERSKDIFRLLFKSFLLLTTSPDKVPSVIKPMLREDPFDWNTYWEAFKTAMGNKKPEDIFEDSNELACVEKVLKTTSFSSDTFNEIIDFDAYRQKILSELEK